MSFFDNLFNNGSSSANKYAQAATNQVMQGVQGANEALSPYAYSGVLSGDITNRLNGINGPQAQQQQFAAFQASPLAQKMGVGGDFQTDPGYRFKLRQGLAAIDSSAASKGLLGSGATLKAEQEYGTGLADQAYGDWVNRLGSVYGNYLGSLGGTTNTGANATALQAGNVMQGTGAGAANTAQIGANKTAGANGLAGLLTNAASSVGKAFAL